MIITISGRPGSGKSVVASKVAEALGMARASAGDFMRELARERDLSILELSRVAEESDEIDREIDERTVRLAAEGRDLVIDARLGWHFVPDSFKVFLEVRPSVAAQRVFEASRRVEHENIDLETTRRAIEERTFSEQRRYLDYYGLDYSDHGHYDLVVDTSEMTIDQVVARIVEAVGAPESGKRGSIG